MAEIKVKDLPIQPAPQLTDYAITDNAGGTLTEKTTWQTIKNLFGSPPPSNVFVGGEFTRSAGAGSNNQNIIIASQPTKQPRAIWIISGQFGGGGGAFSNGFCSSTPVPVPPPSFFQSCSNTNNNYDNSNIIRVIVGANGYTGTITGIGNGVFIISFTQLGAGLNIGARYLVEMA